MSVGATVPCGWVCSGLGACSPGGEAGDDVDGILDIYSIDHIALSEDLEGQNSISININININIIRPAF